MFSKMDSRENSKNKTFRKSFPKKNVKKNFPKKDVFKNGFSRKFQNKNL